MEIHEATKHHNFNENRPQSDEAANRRKKISENRSTGLKKI